MDGMQSTNCVKKIPLIMVLLCVFIGGCIEVSVHVKRGGGGSSSNPDNTELPPAPPCSLQEKSLAIVGYEQENNSVCWAASGQMVLNYKRVASDQEPLKQCDIVDAVLNRGSERTCCGHMKDPDFNCAVGGYPELVFGKYGFTSNEYENPVNKENLWAKITREICAERPFVLVEYYKGGSGHSYVIYGFGGNDQIDKWVDLYDHQSPPPSTPLTGELDPEQFNFDPGIYFVPGNDPMRSSVYYMFDIQP